MNAKKTYNQTNQILYAKLLCKLSALLQKENVTILKNRLDYTNVMLPYLLAIDGYFLNPNFYKNSIDYFITKGFKERAKFLFYILNNNYNGLGFEIFNQYIQEEEYEKCNFCKDFYTINEIKNVKIEQIEYDEHLINTNDVNEIVAESIVRLQLKRSEFNKFIDFTMDIFYSIVAV